jgi:hemerythrin-like domain-containing protein
MTDDVARILGELRQDHRNMALMLNLLERESNNIYEGKESDFELIQDIMHYMTVYPDAVHHPKEDKVYAELQSVRPDLASGFARITVDHRRIAELGMNLRDEISLVESGGIVRRNSVVSNALRYVNTLRSHMQWEELDLFHRVEEMIADGHNFIDPANLPHSSDPVFGSEVEENFGRLFKSIEQARAGAH